MFKILVKNDGIFEEVVRTWRSAKGKSSRPIFHSFVGSSNGEEDNPLFCISWRSHCSSLAQ